MLTFSFFLSKVRCGLFKNMVIWYIQIAVYCTIYSGVTAKWVNAMLHNDNVRRTEQLNSERAFLKTVWLFVVLGISGCHSGGRNGSFCRC